MKNPFFTLCCLCLLLSSSPWILNAQDIKSLDNKKGFKDLLIGDSIQLYRSFFKFIEKSNDGYDVFGIREENPEAKQKYAQLGYIPIRQLNLLVYKGIIHEIRIFFAFETHEDLKSILIKAYGEPNDLPCEISESDAGKRSDCRWQGKTIHLWCTAIDIPEKQKVIVGFKDFRRVIQMRKELTAAALSDL